MPISKLRKRLRKSPSKLYDVKTGESIQVSEGYSFEEEPKKMEEKMESTTKKDLIDLLEEDITQALSIKADRDKLNEKIKDLEGKLSEIEEHKEARLRAESRLEDLENNIVKLKDDNGAMDDEIKKYKDQLDEKDEKIKKYEKALLRIKEKVVDFDKKLD
ncbi:hypothetical protein ACFLQI_03585 [Candidatus Undinarchaeota archaeon]